jgi:3D (Asp-Asp-Asp) domain-containing protein
MFAARRTTTPRRACSLALLLAFLGSPPAALAAGSGGSGGATAAGSSGANGSSPPGGSGGAGIGSGGLAPNAPPPSHIPPPPSKKAKGRWLNGFELTEYWPAPESWFVGKLVSAPGLSGLHRIDWLYSATGVSMQGEGLGLDGKLYHIDSLGNAGWVTASGGSTAAAAGFSAGAPFWRAGAYWRNRRGSVTFPLQSGGWSAGKGRRYVPLRGVTFAAGPSLPLKYYQSIAVDPGVIPLGSRIYIPAYRHDGHGGWFVAQDTGGAINGRHVDVFRSPPSTPNSSGQLFEHQRVFVIRPHR